ncbi:hypothetical protein HPB48_003754 [Haemaphysalis longicornis]|uniref:Uncharacterized protein n=1 Tax=Haemaphysalis longicornis TaxID=44386 RepID=A0A9J6FFT1_HAELO|nr:hypothetical protein HPB48_003754 [Haemaphysalis longicornis]
MFKRSPSPSPFVSDGSLALSGLYFFPLLSSFSSFTRALCVRAYISARVCSEMSCGSRRHFTATFKLKAFESPSRMGIWRRNASLAFRRKVCGTGEARKLSSACATLGKNRSVDVKRCTPSWRTKWRTSSGNFVHDRSRLQRKPPMDRLRELYNEWIAGDKEQTHTGRLQRPSLAIVSSWVSLSWQSLPDDMVARAFRKCSISNAPNGKKDDSEKQSSSDDSESSDE